MSFSRKLVLGKRADALFRQRAQQIEHSGLWEAVAGNVLIYIHKEQRLDDVAERYPARHYVMVDDKLRNARRLPQSGFIASRG